MLTPSGASKNSGKRVTIEISTCENLHESRLQGYPPSVSDQRHPFADPWGLPAEEPSDEAQPPLDRSTETHPDEEPAGDTEPTEPTEPDQVETPAADTEPTEPTEPDQVETPAADTEPTEPTEPDQVETPAAETQTSEHAVEEPTVGTDAGFVSPAQVDAKNVLDALGADLDDLPDEPPDWMEDTTSVSPPSVYEELASLGTTDIGEVGEVRAGDLEDRGPGEAGYEDAGVMGMEEVDRAGTEPEGIEPEVIEPQEIEPEEGDLEAILREVSDTVEPMDEAETVTEESLDEAPEPGYEPGYDEEPEDTTDLDTTVEAAADDIETPTDEQPPPEPGYDEEPDYHEEPDYDEEPEDTTDLDTTVEAAADDIETPTDEQPPPEPGYDEEPEYHEEPEDTTDLETALREAIGAVEPTDEPATIAEGFLEKPGYDEGPEDTTDLDTSVEAADDDIETPTDEVPEPGDETRPEPDLEAALREAIDAVEPEDSVAEDSSPLIESPTVAWGSSWATAAQGWVQQEGGRSTWRPIVTTTSSVGAWEVDTFLGIVAGDATMSDVEHLAGAREAALRALVDEALSRGAHAVVGVRTEVHRVGQTLLFSAVGTAVTLRNPT
jgi:uncharacterized protein YbjQ (UPF0145 family)